MLKISKHQAESDHLVLKLEGKLVGRWVGLLEEICDGHVREVGTSLRLDVSAVSFADRNGVQLLHRLRNQGVAFQACSPFLAALCEDTG